MTEVVDLRADVRAFPLLPPFDQGPRPVCTAVAVTGAHEISRSAGEPVVLAVEALWQHALTRGDADGGGTSLRAMRDALVDTGQPLESEWPFLEDIFDLQLAPTAAGPPPWFIATMNPIGRMATDISAELEAGNAVVAILDVTDAFADAGRTGFVSDPAREDERFGLHAVLCLASGVDAESQLYILVRNSWGHEWGLDGYAWISAAHMDSVNVAAAVVTAVD